jgi:hypothetical protein
VQNPARSSQLGSAGGDRERLLGLEAGGIDGALLSYAQATIAVRKGMNVLADANLFLMGVGEPITSHLKFGFVRKVRDTLILFLQKETDCFHLCVGRPKERRAIRWARSHWSYTWCFRYQNRD